MQLIEMPVYTFAGLIVAASVGIVAAIGWAIAWARAISRIASLEADLKRKGNG